MTNNKIVDIENDKFVMDFFRKSQSDGMKRSKGVFVKSFSFTPQSEGFYLHVNFHVPDCYYDEDDSKGESFYGTPFECVTQAIKYMENEILRIIKDLEEK